MSSRDVMVVRGYATANSYQVTFAQDFTQYTFDIITVLLIIPSQQRHVRVLACHIASLGDMGSAKYVNLLT
jgi:hypothetical protein